MEIKKRSKIKPKSKLTTAQQEILEYNLEAKKNNMRLVRSMLAQGLRPVQISSRLRVGKHAVLSIIKAIESEST